MIKFEGVIISPSPKIFKLCFEVNRIVFNCSINCIERPLLSVTKRKAKKKNKFLLLVIFPFLN